MNVLPVKENETPATKYPLRKVGSAELVRSKYKKGFYFMEGVDGYDFFYVEKPIEVTSLKIDGETWMVDDPLHNIGMKRLAENSEGKVLVGGLGLGLVIHELVKNPKVKQIDVVERNKDVIDLISPNLPNDKVKIYNADVFDFKDKDYDTIILDLWVRGEGEGENNFSMLNSMLNAYTIFKSSNPKGKVFIWGIRDKELNPAYKGVSKEYLEMINEYLRNLKHKFRGEF